MPRSGRVLALAAAVLLLAALPAAAAERFPRGFLWGTASAGFQVEAGGSPRTADRRSDWWAFTTDPGLVRAGVVSGDRVDRGPGFWRTWRRDLYLARGRLGGNAIRLGMEWSRVFPRSTARVRTGASVSRAELRRLDRLADPAAVRRYRRILRGARARGLEVMLTLNHFTLPIWVHEPLGVRRAFAGRGPDDPVPGGLERAGWLDRATVAEFRKYAAYVAWRFGDLVDLYATVNEPLVTVSQGFVSIPGVTGTKAPAVLSYPAALRALEHLGLANAAAYDAVHARDRRARVGFVHNLVAWRPADPASPRDVAATANADRVFNRAWLELALRGHYDADADGVADPGERRRRLAGKADFVGVNHYSPGRVTGLGAPVSARVPLFDFAPAVTYRGTGNPGGPPCPTRCTDFGWEIDPAGLREVVELAASYGTPVYVTENGIDDREDDDRPGYLRGYLAALHDAIAAGADVRGYFHWSLLDNFEWAEGFGAAFGLYAFDPRTLRRTERPSARLFARIARANALP
jgi:beta-glucosidase/6-phospho-beta-glucosidase/beta-galactosidase